MAIITLPGPHDNVKHALTGSHVEYHNTTVMQLFTFNVTISRERGLASYHSYMATCWSLYVWETAKAVFYRQVPFSASHLR